MNSNTVVTTSNVMFQQHVPTEAILCFLIIFCWVALQKSDVPANTKFSAVHIPCISSKLRISYISLNFRIVNKILTLN
jgi:hypothetical protein